MASATVSGVIVDVRAPLVWTEAFGCGPIAQSALNSFLAHHDYEVAVFGYASDFEQLDKNPRVRFVVPGDAELSHLSEAELRNAFRNGHSGLSLLWSHILDSTNAPCAIHFDSDLIFLGNAIDDIYSELINGSALVGRRRMYRFARMEPAFHSVPDTVDTVCFGLDIELVSRLRRAAIKRLIEGQDWMSRLRRSKYIDFFDAMSVWLMGHGRVTYIDSPDGGTHGETNDLSDFGQKILQFGSAIATGYALEHGSGINVPEPYRSDAIRNYRVFAYLMMDEPLEPAEIPVHFRERAAQLDRVQWMLKPL